MVQRRMLRIQGTVQGVGFRPHAYRIAKELELSGLIKNDGWGVIIEVEGDVEQLAAFPQRLLQTAPPLAGITHLQTESIPPRGSRQFVIERSDQSRDRCVLVSPDVATCGTCLTEIADPSDRRYKYPFTNCTDCGPRFTIVTDVPYDRATTTMARFDMCDACACEYRDPSNRRFHAQPIACHECGPLLWFHRGQNVVHGADALAAAGALIRSGGVVAVKGLGGYHVVCDATSESAVDKLRRRKHRDAKPLAIMVRDVNAVHAVAMATESEQRLLTSRERPIVLLKKALTHQIAASVAPHSDKFGILLPYTPLHRLLLDDLVRPLVMTSGNLAEEPIAHVDHDAERRLTGLVDGFLGHDRAIAVPCDDSVMQVVADRPAFIRRSRGCAPNPIQLATVSRTHVLGVGGHLKNTFCLAKERSAFVSHHIGDLENEQQRRSWRDAIGHYARIFDIDPRVVAHDLHPDYATSRLAEALDDVERVGVQHHHAHVASAVAEHGLGGPVLGVVFDGAGLGSDGAIWGGEFLLVDGARCERLAHMSYVPMPGGDQAAREPWRMAAAYLRSAYGRVEHAPIAPAGATSDQLSVLSRMMERGVNTPRTSSVGRLFDAVAALIGIRGKTTFEAQAAIELEALAMPGHRVHYPWEISKTHFPWQLDMAPIIRGVVDDVLARRAPREIASTFHNTLAALIVDVVTHLKKQCSVQSVVLTGGVFQNVRLTEETLRRFGNARSDVFLQERVPCNDGGLSLGQVHVARCIHPER